MNSLNSVALKNQPTPRRSARDETDEAFDLVPAAIYLCDDQGVIVRSNKMAKQFLRQVSAQSQALLLFSAEGKPLRHEDTPVAQAISTGRCYRNIELWVEQPAGKRVGILANIDAIKDNAGHITGAIVCFQEIAPRTQEHASQHNTAAASGGYHQLHEVLDALPTAVYMTDAGGCITYYNQACVDLAGRVPKIGTDKWCVTWRLYWPDGTRLPHCEYPMAIALKEKRQVEGTELIAERPDGTRVPALAYPSPLYDTAGVMLGAINMIVDISERKRAEDDRQLLLNELNHRVKNTLTTVQAIAAQSFRKDSDNSSYQWFEGRLIALSKTHDVLARTRWESASLTEIIAQVTTPLLAKGHDRFQISGADLSLRSTMALSLAMALHELCTNAAKYGALSNQDGRVSIQWKVVTQGGDHTLHFHWEETGGPPVAVPQHKGFGTRLIERGLSSELGANIQITYHPGGLVCDISTPLQ